MRSEWEHMQPRLPGVDAALELAELIARARAQQWTADELRLEAEDVHQLLGTLPAAAFEPALRSSNHNLGDGATIRSCELVIACGLYEGRRGTLTANVANRRHRTQRRRERGCR